MVWESGPSVVIFGILFRLIGSILPIALLWITKLIIDGIVAAVSRHQPVSPRFWWLVVAEFGVAITAAVLARATPAQTPL